MKKALLILLVMLLLICTVVFVSCGGDEDHQTDNSGTNSTPVCKHDDPTQIVVVESVAPTCQETGLTQGMKCTLCDIMVVPQATVEIIDCIESDWMVDEEVTPTEDGKHHTECTMCGKIFREEIILAGYKKLEYILLDNGTYEVSGIGTCDDTDIVIPGEYNGLPVTSIGERAFSGCTSLTSVNIPDSVTSIGKYAFLYCTSLQYNECDNAYYLGNENNPCIILIKAKDESITSCEIHNETKFINSGAFADCTSLKSITIPDSVTSIGSEAFFGCGSLTNVVISNSVTSIGANTFYRCISLRNVMIGNSVTSIGASAFGECTDLRTITIPSSVTSIGWGAFYASPTDIYCKADYKPNGWDDDWNLSYYTTILGSGEYYLSVVWGYQE